MSTQDERREHLRLEYPCGKAGCTACQGRGDRRLALVMLVVYVVMVGGMWVAAKALG